MKNEQRTSARVAIVGGGLSGLYAAWRLTQQGISDWVLFEARDTLGGRIVSVGAPDVPHPTDRWDMGPSWFWPGVQPQLDRLIHGLALARFEQHDAGDMLIERGPQSPVQRVRGYTSSPPSMRLVGGMAALTEALCQRLEGSRLRPGHTVRELHLQGDVVELVIEPSPHQSSLQAPAHSARWQVDQVLLALPPRLVAAHIACNPALPATLARQWRDTPTWMAPHAKYVALYETPFWRAQGLSGEARSAHGPMAEIHDASGPASGSPCGSAGGAALFGFVGVPAQVRQGVAEATLRAHCRAQLARLFGPEAATPTAEWFKDWAQDPHTATPQDWVASGEHPHAPDNAPAEGPWAGRLVGIGSEWSRAFAGYLAGAVDAAEAGLRQLRMG